MGLKILIVDDSKMIRKNIEKGIQEGDETFSVIRQFHTAENGVEAVQLYKEHKPDLVTMDLTMDEMDGCEAIKSIIAVDPEADIIVISALKDRGTAIESIKLGAKGFINKPAGPDELRTALVKLGKNSRRAKVQRAFA